ncbi:hypothetical protein ALQ65_02824 [Pseudomonas syringae pv. coriandricola]|uniref:Uncharacterized protein n=1 Tax=Pseudomonas syringae pv. coriandricola TaxID=264453 RepID=A0A3M3JRW5_9PSED|nr:hypothetical protein ALQ65_02824 [Pseudomonas syringae pv. coriandricola]
MQVEAHMQIGAFASDHLLYPALCFFVQGKRVDAGGGHCRVVLLEHHDASRTKVDGQCLHHRDGASLIHEYPPPHDGVEHTHRCRKIEQIALNERWRSLLICAATRNIQRISVVIHSDDFSSTSNQAA